MVFYLYFVCMFMLILLSVVTGDIHYLSLHTILLITFLHLFAYGAWAVGGFLDEEDKGKRKRLTRK